MQDYYKFKKDERKFREYEFEKAYRDVIGRLTRELSKRLHVLQDYSKILRDRVNGHNVDKEEYGEAYEIVSDNYKDYLRKVDAFLKRVATKLEDRICTVLQFEYESRNYIVDPYDNCFNDAQYYFFELKRRIREDQVDKDLILVAYDYIEMMRFFGELPSFKRQAEEMKKTTLISPPPSKKPRIVPRRK